VRQQRRAVNLALSAAASLLVLAGLAGWQWTVATEQRDRAERTLEAATQTANSLVFDLAQQLRDRAGMPADLVRNILDRARKLQSQLTESGETSPELRRSEAAALIGLADTLYSLGDSKSALEAASRAREILEGLTAIDPANEEWQRWLSVSDNKIGGLLMLAGQEDKALEEYRKGLAIREKFAATGEHEWQRDVAVSYNKLGDVLRAEGGTRRRSSNIAKASRSWRRSRRATPAISNGGAISQSAIPRSAARSWSSAVVTRPRPNIARGSTSTSNPPTRIRATLCGSAISR
jgi:tetratricopeptide (TPR) repeat protein